MKRLLSLFRPYKLPAHVTEFRFRPGLANLWIHIRQTTPRMK